MNNIEGEFRPDRLIRLKQLESFLSSFSPEPLYRAMARKLIYTTYNLTATGFDAIPDTGPALLICNHVSFMDGLIINAVCKRKVRFIIDQVIYEQPLIHYFMRLDQAIPIYPKKESVEQAMEAVSEGLRKGDVICIFPEGQITYTGFLSHFRPGTEWIIKRNPVPIYPVILEGLWGSIFSRKYLKSPYIRFIPKDFRRKVTAVCGEVISPENVTIDALQIKMLELRDSVLEMGESTSRYTSDQIPLHH